MFLIHTLAATIALLFTVSHTIAQSAEQLRAHGISPAFFQYLQSKSNRDVINQVIRAQVARLPGSCTDIAIDSKFNVIVLAPVDFDGRAFTRGAWKEFVDATSCGRRRTHNVLTAVRPDGALQRSPMLPGSTRADIQLQGDAARMLYASLHAYADKGCQPSQFFIDDTKFVSMDSVPIPNAKAGPNARAWLEEWTALACGKAIPLQVRFTPDATGTGFAVRKR